MGEIVGGERWNSETQIWGQSKWIQNPGPDFGLSRSFFPRLWTKRIFLRWLHICWKVDERCLFTISYLIIFILQGSPFTALVSQNLELMTNSFCFKPTQLSAISGTRAWNGVGADYFPGIKSPHRAERSIGAHLFFMVIKFSGNISILNAFKLDDQHSYFLY